MGDSVVNSALGSATEAASGVLDKFGAISDMASKFNPEEIFANLKNSLQFDNIWANIVGLKDMIPEPLVELYNTHTVPLTLLFIAVLVLFAFEGYKLFKMLVYVIGGVGAGILGYWKLGAMIPESIKTSIPENMDIYVLTAVVCALVAVLICKVAYTGAIGLLGVATGYLFGSKYIFEILLNSFSDLHSLINNDTFAFIVGTVFAAIFCIVFVLIFKHLFVVLSSFGCMVLASTMLQKILCPTADENLKTTFLIVGLVIGALAMIRQYKEEEKAMEIVF